MSNKLIIILLSIVSIFFLTAQSCSVGTTASGLAADCEGEGDILCNDDGEAYECALASYGAGYYTSRASEYDEDCAEETEDEEEEAESEEEVADADGDGVADTDDVCADEDDTVDYDADEIPDCIDDEVMVADCSDTDGGSDYYTAGVVTYDDGSGEVEYTESCEAGYDYAGTLTEYSCNDYGELLTEEVECTYGCAEDYTSCATEEAEEETADTTTDTDDDGLTDDEETTYSTDAADADSDDDGLTDGEEVLGLNDYSYTSDPMNEDTDDDTLSDYEEVLEGDDGYISDPNTEDTNGDGLLDSIEVAFSIDPQDTYMDENHLFFDLVEDSATAMYTSGDGTITGTVDIYTDDEGEDYGYLDGSDTLTVDIADGVVGAEAVVVMVYVMPDEAQNAMLIGINSEAADGSDTCDEYTMPFSLSIDALEYAFRVTTDAASEEARGDYSGGWARLTGLWMSDTETMYLYVDNSLAEEVTGVSDVLADGGTLQIGASACGDDYFAGGISAAKVWALT